MKLYELGRLSSGTAAELAGTPRVAFLGRLSESGVDTFRQTEAELAATSVTSRLLLLPRET